MDFMVDKFNELIDEINNLKEKQLIKLEIERTDIMLKIKADLVVKVEE